MKETQDILRINKFQNKKVYDYAVGAGEIGMTDLCLIQNDDNMITINSIEFDIDNNKIIYKTSDGVNHEVISSINLRNTMNLHAIATSGNYNDLSNTPKINGVALTGNVTIADLGIQNNYNDADNKPKINGVTLIGDKTTDDLGITFNYDALLGKPSINGKVLQNNISSSELKINYTDIVDTPVIPSISSNYSSTDESMAISGKGVAQALSNYVNVTNTVTGTGALSGGGALTSDIQITHKSAPSGMTPNAVKVAVDTYGHVQIGAGITASDVNAQPTSAAIIGAPGDINGNNSIIYAMVYEDTTLGFSIYPKNGHIMFVYLVNESGNDVTVSIPASLGTYTSVYYNNAKISSNASVSVPNGTVKKLEITAFDNDTYKMIFIS